MKISTSTISVIKTRGLETGMKALADAGFEAIDYSLTQNALPLDIDFLQNASSDEFSAHFKSIARTIHASGLEIGQCHAPYGSTTVDTFEIYEPLLHHTIRSIYAAGYMEAPCIVAHPVLHRDFCNGQNRDHGIQATIEYFSAMAPALKATGVIMCIENLFFTVGKGLPKATNICSDSDDLCTVIDTLNDMHGPHFAACVDTGHAVIAHQDPCQLLTALGSRTKALHIQDNRGMKDDHLLPVQGMIHWKDVAQTLGKVGYQGTFNFEVTPIFTNLPPEVYPQDAFLQACRFLYSIGRSLADIAENTFAANGYRPL